MRPRGEYLMDESEESRNAAWKEQARAHWKAFRPTLFRDLEKAGKLEAALDDAVQRTFQRNGRTASEWPCIQFRWPTDLTVKGTMFVFLRVNAVASSPKKY
jgi:hypothetical protein